MILDKTEKRDGLAIYWLADAQTGERVCGIAFVDGRLNIHNQEIAESIVFAISWIKEDLGPFLNTEGVE